MDYLLLAAGLLVGGIFAWLLMKGKVALAESNGRATGEVERTSLTEQLKAASQDVANTTVRLADAEGKVQELQTALADLREKSGQLTADVSTRKDRITELEKATEKLTTERDSLVGAQSGHKSRIAELQTTLELERTQTQDKVKLLTEAREQLSNQFKALANEILDEKSKKFTEQNKENLGQLLDPLKAKITDFQKKVEEVHVEDIKDRSALAEQVKMLTELNTTLSQDAQNLTLALKGDSKAQGNWGEILLEDVLERAGLVRGQHYDVQESVKIDDGLSRVIPDVVIHLPGNRHIVVDSKMTLPDYRAFASADDDTERAAALKRHLVATRAHMKDLSEKNYQTLYGVTSLDFVVMFMPLEPAFMLAVTNDQELFYDGWEKNVLLVSPSTLLFVIRTVANLWRQEGLSRNAQEISKRGAELFDKLVGFVTDLQNVGKRIDQAQDSYNEAHKKLSEGRGNVIRQAEMLKNLGVKPTKALPAQWVDSAAEEAIARLTHDTNPPISTSDSVDSSGS